MKIFALNILLFLSFQLLAQKQTQEIIDASHLQNISFEGNEIYKIVVRTAPVDHITISTRTDGEYFNEISLDTEIKQHSLLLKSRFRNELKNGFDKLSAHKVLSMEVELKIPEDMTIEIISNVAMVYLKGDFERVLVQVKAGSCFLEDFTGNARINSLSGNIFVETTNATVTAHTRHGSLEMPAGLVGAHNIKLTSISGNIQVKETK